MAYNGLPRIRNRPVSAGTWDLSGRQRLADDLHVRFADSGYSRSRNDRDVPLYSGRVTDSSAVAQVRYVHHYNHHHHHRRRRRRRRRRRQGIDSCASDNYRNLPKGTENLTNEN